MWYLLLFALVDVASAYVSSTLVGSVEDHLCNGGIWDVTKMGYVVNGDNTLYTSQQCADYCGNMIYTMGSFNPGDTIRHYATNRVDGTDKKCFCHYLEFTTNNHCEIQSNQDSNEYYDILYIDTAVICTEGEICTLVQATIQDNALNNIHTEQNPMALNTGSPSFIFGGVQGGWFKMVRTNWEGVMQETRYIGPQHNPSVTDIAGLDISKWNDAASTSDTDVEGKTTCVTNRYCVQDFEWSVCTSSTSPLSAPCSYGEECTGGDDTYTLNMFDSYGDGWHDGYLNVDYGDGLKSYTVSGSSSTVTFTGTITVMYMEFETWASEISWTLTVNGVSKTWNGFTNDGHNGQQYTVDLSRFQTCTSQTCPVGKAYFDGECMLPCLIPTTQYYHAYGQTLIRPYQGKGSSVDTYGASYYPTTKDELTQMCLDACTGVTQVPDTYTGDTWASVSPFTPADYAKFNAFEVMDDPSSSFPGRCYCHTYTPASAIAAGITPFDGNTASYSYYIIDKTSEGCVPAPTAPPCVFELALLEEDCSYSGGTCPKGYIYLGNNECRPESDIPCGAGKYIDATFSCINCQAGRFSATGGLSCESCPTGFESNDDHTACVQPPSCSPGQVLVQGQVVDRDATIAATPVLVSNVCSNQMTVHELTKMETSYYPYAFADPVDRLKKFAFTHQGYERCPYDNPDNDANSCYGAGANEGNCAGKCSPTAPADCFTICFEKNADSMVLYDWNVISLSYGWKSSAKCYCLNTTLSCGENVALPDSSRKSLKYDFQTVSSGDFVCEDCPAGSYQDQVGQSSCESCPAGSYQDQVGQPSCESCSVGYIPNADKTDCSYCPAVDTTFNVDWATGCGPWATVNGCLCDCGDSGFTGDHCDVCGKGMGWNGVSGQGANCTDCPFPYVNDQLSHDAVCSQDYCPPGQGTTQDEHTWSADNTTENCVQCTGITVSPDFYGQCAEIVCEGRTVPKSVIDHTLATSDPTNCEPCPVDMVYHGGHCLTPECPNGVPKDTIDQDLSYNDPQNCDFCPDGSIKDGIACVSETCQAGTGANVNEYPYVLNFTQVQSNYTVGVEGDLTLVVYESGGSRVALTLNAPDNSIITDLALVGDRLAVVVRVYDWSQGSYSGRVEFFEITEPLGIRAEVYLGSPHVIQCGTGDVTDICQYIAVDGETYYLGYDTKVEEYSNNVVVATHDIRGAHVSVGGHTVAGGSLGVGVSLSYAYIEFIYDGTKRSERVSPQFEKIYSIAVRDDGAFVAVGTYSKIFIWDVIQNSSVLVTLNVGALDSIVWVADNVFVGHASGLDEYDSSGTHIRKVLDDSVVHLSKSTNSREFPATVMINVQTDRLLKQIDTECSTCVAPLVSDGTTHSCTRVECSDPAESVLQENVDVTLAFDDDTNCGPCSGFNSGNPCLPIECDDTSVLKPLNAIDNTLAHTDQSNCDPCTENQVVVDSVCQNIICSLGAEIHRVSGAYGPSDERNCRDCVGWTVGDGKSCIDIDCGVKVVNPTVDRTLGYQNHFNCGDECPSGHIVSQTDKTKCSACTGLTVPNEERNECIVPVCEEGFQLKDIIDNSNAEGTSDYSSNCEDINECDPNPCQGKCRNMRGQHVCNDDILFGHDIGSFVNKNKHICDYGFVLSTEEPASVSDIGDLDKSFSCPDLITHKENIVYNNTQMTSTMTEVRTSGVFKSQHCSYEYKKLQLSEEEFSEDRDSAMDSGNVYIYCPSRCTAINPCAGTQTCVHGSCVDHTCDDNAQASECTCYGSECTGYCMDNGECVDVLVDPNITALEEAFANISNGVY